MRASLRNEVVVEVAADEAWRVVTRADLLHLWFPGVVDCRLTGDLRTGVRTVTLATGLTLDEAILTNDALLRRFQYRIDSGLFVDHLSTVDVFALGPARCLVSYGADADPATMAIVLGGASGAALAELRRQLEAGAGPAVEAARTPRPEAITEGVA